MTDEPSTAKLWLVRVIIPAALIVGVGLLVTRRAAAPVAAVAPTDLDSAQRLHRIGLAINDATTNLGRPPADLAELRPYLVEHGDPDMLVVSPADGQPFVFLWGIDVRSAGYDTVLAYERFGTGGRRVVLTASTVLEMTPEEFRKVVPLPTDRPPTPP
jgi:hypothetical protein